VSQESLVRRTNRASRPAAAVQIVNEVAGVPSYADLTPAVVIDLDGEQVPVAQLEDLKAMKRASQRDKDSVDLAELEALAAD